MIRDSHLNERVNRVAERLAAQGVRVEVQEKQFTPCRFDLGVLSPGIDPSRPIVEQLRRDKVPVIGELELAFRFCDCPVIAITGTNGKSTTTELIAAILTAGGKKTVACGNLGVPMSEAVRQSATLDVLTVEVSSFQLEAIDGFRPRISVYLNFTPDHLDRYKSMEEYRAAKVRIFENQTSDDFAIINTASELPPIKARTITFNAFGGPAHYTFEQGWLVARGERVLEQSTTKLAGPHNAENQLSALAVADIYGIPRDKAVEALRAYTPLPHRCEVVRELGGVLYVNDSKATNIDAMEKALLAYDRPIVLVAGGKDKGFDFDPIRPIVEKRVKAAVLIGEVQDKLARSWDGAAPCHRAADLAEAVSLSRSLAAPGDVVLLSPGCSSYDMFKNFEERGNIFRELVTGLE